MRPEQGRATPAVIEVAGADVSLGGTPVLHGAALRVESGELGALSGANGSGRSPLLRTAVGAATPQAGTARPWAAPAAPPQPPAAGHRPPTGRTPMTASGTRPTTPPMPGPPPPLRARPSPPACWAPAGGCCDGAPPA